MEFSLRREGQLDQPLTVNVGVTQTNTSEEEEADFISGTPPATATFAANSDTAMLTVTTVNDGTPELHGTISAAISSSEN